MTSVVLVDDQDLVRAGLRALLAHDPAIAVVGEASDGVRGAEVAARCRPDVVLMDLRMPRADGLEGIRRIRADARLADTRVVVLSTFHDEADVAEAIRAGAAGYLLKDASGPDLRAAVHAAAAGESVLSPDVARRVLQLVAATPPRPHPHPRLATLTDRELAVLERVGHGDTNDEIAAALFLSPATARTYVSRILAKLGARDRTELAIIAHRSGLV
ncbi:response regulator [Cellulomonas telluris]|uniref:response regulator n=1 Tax=Cellulomonas telluris TaxID=2306636 RepID=UPI0010A7B5AE|nr:response regulator transcription factor [Cellulomonas telluris]